MGDLRGELERATERIVDYRERLPEARVGPVASRADVRQALGALPDGPASVGDVIDELVAVATPGSMASAGPRYFGFVIGGSLDAAPVADVITAGWDQCAFNEALSPAALAFEDVAGELAQGAPRACRRPRRSGSSTGAQAREHGRPGRRALARPRRGAAGTSGATVSTAPRGCGSSSAPSATRRSIAQCGCSVSARRAIEEVPPPPNGAMDPWRLHHVLDARPARPDHRLRCRPAT